MTPLRLGLLLVAGLGCAGPAAAQTIPYGGSEVFRFALHQKGLQPLTNIRDALADPQNSVIIVFGDARPLDLMARGMEIRSFVARGGALLVATDSPSQSLVGGIGWANAFEIEVTGQHIQTAAARGYRGSPTRPYVRPLDDPFKFMRRNGPSPYDLFAGVPEAGPAAVATDRPSEMRVPAHLNNFIVNGLARYPNDATRLTGGRVEAQFSYFAVSFRPAPEGSPGRALVLADNSVFANGMLGFVADNNAEKGYSFDNGNWQFTNRTIDWLRGGWAQPRSKCLFVENGAIVPKFAVELPPGGPPPPMPDLPPEVIANWLLNNADPILNEYQDKHVFDKFFEQRVSRIIFYLLIGATIVFAFIALRRLIRGYRQPGPRPLTPAVAEGMLPRRGVVWQRTDAQLEVGNLYEAARHRVRDRFDRLGGGPGRDGEMPPVLVANDVRDGELLRSAVAWLWPIGYGDAPVPVPPTEWDRVNALLERLTRRAALGDWSFGVEV